LERREVNFDVLNRLRQDHNWIFWPKQTESSETIWGHMDEIQYNEHIGYFVYMFLRKGAKIVLARDPSPWVQVAYYLYKRESAAGARVGNLIKRWSAPAENSIVKKHVRGGKCRNTDRGPNKNVHSPFLSLLEDRRVFLFLRGLPPETCIFVQVAKKRFALADLEKKLRSQPGTRNRQEKYTLSFSSCVILMGIFLYAADMFSICPQIVSEI